MRILGWSLAISMVLHAALLMLCPFPDPAMPILEEGCDAVMVTLSPAPKTKRGIASPITQSTLKRSVPEAGRNPAAKISVTPKVEPSQASHAAPEEQTSPNTPSKPFETVPTKATPKAKPAIQSSVEVDQALPPKAADSESAPPVHQPTPPAPSPSVDAPPVNTILKPASKAEDNPADTISAVEGWNGPAITGKLSGNAVIEAKPLYRLNKPPSYPRLARRKGYEGKVLMDVLVGVNGEVMVVKIAVSSGYHILDRASLKAVQTWRFEPGHRGGQKAAMWVKVPIRFRLE